MLLDPLEHEIAERLRAAGDRARSSHFATPDRGFSEDLRDRLMTAAGDRASDRANDRANDRADDRARVRVAWSLPSFFRVPRLVPVLAATLLLLVGVAAARELYVAIGNRPEATPTPEAAAVREMSPTVGPTETQLPEDTPTPASVAEVPPAETQTQLYATDTQPAADQGGRQPPAGLTPLRTIEIGLAMLTVLLGLGAWVARRNG